MVNFIETVNPFKLAEPPQWWLTQLSDYDAQLVVFPSKIRPAYILARRRQASNAMETMNLLDKDLLRKSAGMDGDVLADHNLIYVRHLLGDSVQRSAIFQWLRDHDMLRLGGAEKVANLIESEEEYKAHVEGIHCGVLRPRLASSSTVGIADVLTVNPYRITDRRGRIRS